MKKILFVLAFSLPLLLAACAPDGPATVSLTRDGRFTGRGNMFEPLIEMEIVASGGEAATLCAVGIELDASDSSVGRITLMNGAKELASAKVRDGVRSYVLRCRKAFSDTLRLSVCADILPDAPEGGLVSAEVPLVRFKGSTCAPEAPEGSPREILLCRKLLFAPGDYGSNFYRIPAIRQLSDGTLLVVNDRRNVTENDLPAEIDVVSRYSTDMGQSWSEPLTIARNGGRLEGYGDPGLVETEDGVVVCTFAGGMNFFNSSVDAPQRSYIAVSRDFGRTWSAPRDITWTLWGPNPDNPFCERYHSSFFTSGNSLLLTDGPHKGRILVANVTAMSGNVLCNHAVYSDDSGKTWHVSDLAWGEKGNAGDEAKMVELLDGSILMSVRRSGERGYAISRDGGKTWGERGTWPDLKANACNGDLIRYNEDILMHTLPCSERLRRENVAVFLSFDEGKTWPEHKVISNKDAMYSSLTVLPDGTLGAYIEENINGVELWYERFSLSWLRTH